MLVRLHRGAGARPTRPCGVGQTLLAVGTDGQVMPCHRFLYRPHDWLGSVERPELGEKRQPYLHLATREVLGCDGCVAEAVCGGGCRLEVLDVGGDLQTGRHPAFCITTRAHARAARHIYDVLTAEGNGTFLAALRQPRPLNAALTELLSV